MCITLKWYLDHTLWFYSCLKFIVMYYRTINQPKYEMEYFLKNEFLISGMWTINLYSNNKLKPLKPINGNSVKRQKYVENKICWILSSAPLK